MAKAKRTLTLEEKLEQALVAEEEQPYKVPDNWCWTKLQNIAAWGSGGTPSRKIKEYYEGSILWIKTGELNNDYIYDTEEKISDKAILNSSAKKFPPNTVIIAMYGATIGKVGIMGVQSTTNQACACGVCSDAVYYKYLFYYAISQKDAFIKKGKGGAQPNISQEIIKHHEVPLPPIKEQYRIVDRIERMFLKLDKAKERAREVIDSFEKHKSAILHKAFNGELTRKWRKENGVAKDLWITKKINQVCYPRAGYAFDSKKFTNAGYQIIRMGNLYGGELDLNRNPVFISIDDADEAVLKRALINDGDILITLTGTKYKRDYGYAVCIHNPANLLLNQRILCLTPNYNEIKTDYLLFYLQSDLFRNVFFSNETGGVNQGNVSSKFVENIEFDMPTLDEQAETSKILRNILGKEQQAKEKAEDVLARIELMKKSILARAFRGKLGTNNPDEESSLEYLLKK